jgi:hypothetical protein
MHDRGAPASERLARQRKGLHVRQPGQDRVNRAAQVPDAFAVDDSDAENPALTASGEVIRDQFLDFPGLESMQIQDSINGKLNGVLAGRMGGFFGHTSWIDSGEI